MAKRNLFCGYFSRRFRRAAEQTEGGQALPRPAPRHQVPYVVSAFGLLAGITRRDRRARSFLIDGEAVACDGDGMPSFDRLRYRRADGHVFLYAYDLLELDGADMRREPLEVRKRQLASLLRPALVGLQFNEEIEEPGDVVFRRACKL